MAKKQKTMTKQDLMDLLSEVEPDTPIFFYDAEGRLEDDQRTPLREDDIDLDIEHVIEINIPKMY
jgi:hypothetical protein